MRRADIIVIGGGIIGCSTAWNLAASGAKNVVLLDRGDICSGGTALSCAIVRTHYSIRANLVHAVESLNVYESFGEIVGGDAGFRRTGYMILGPEEHGRTMLQVFRMQNELGIDTAVLSTDEARRYHPLLALDDVTIIGYDARAGYCDPYLATTAYAKQAKSLGVRIHPGAPVIRLEAEGTLKVVYTPVGRVEAPVVIMAAGPWTNRVAGMVGIKLPYVVTRHNVITLKVNRPYEMSWPIVKDLTTPMKLYFRPEIAGKLLVGTGDHGDPVDIDRGELTSEVVPLEHVVRLAATIERRMPAYGDARYVDGWTGPYDVTPDWNPIVGPVPGFEGLYVAVGFSGHGFKLAPTIGEALAQCVLGLEPRVPIDSYALKRFEEGRTLNGAYGTGSIS